MHFIKKHFALLVLFSLLIVPLFFFSSCGEDDIITPQGEHFEPAGLFIIPEGSSDTILQVFNGVVRAGDTLKAPLNLLSTHWEVYFWDDNRNVLNPPNDGSHTLGFTIRDASVVETEMDDPNDWAFHLKGLSLNPDTTSMQIKVNHSGHADFTTPYIPIKVDPCEIPAPEGFVVIDTVTNQIIARDSAGFQTGDTIVVNTGSSTNRLKIFWLDGEGNRFQPCDSYTLSAVTNPNGIAVFTNKPGEFSFKIEGIAAGTALLSIRLFRDANFIYGTRNIPVKVN
ncbi:MAG: hypothetical protein UZ05_CHB002000915 [Chlorobi bacterium OLB5]|nr:MAG: hypothetical protein UZ05_CHB002000915 [Chlorobi bacterium OLB5]